MRLTVAARNGAAVDEIVRACRLRAAISGNPIEVADELFDNELRLVSRLEPDVVVCLASTQSPYERTTRRSGWTDLVEQAGFGVTLPFQAAIALRLARAIAVAHPTSLLINGCFPDAVNPLIASLGLPVHCGIGNVATLAAALQTALGKADQRDLAVLGHHVQLAEPPEPDEEVLAWLGGVPVPDVTRQLAPYRALPRRELNAAGGHAAARLLADLLSGKEIRTNLPGPLGLPGGYPVRLAGSRIVLNLPAEVSRTDAIDWNLRAGRRDGIEVAHGRVEYQPAAASALDEVLPEFAGGWPVTALDAVSVAFSALRQQLRQIQPLTV
jgi:hypothetical protein